MYDHTVQEYPRCTILRKHTVSSVPSLSSSIRDLTTACRVRVVCVCNDGSPTLNRSQRSSLSAYVCCRTLTMNPRITWLTHTFDPVWYTIRDIKTVNHCNGLYKPQRALGRGSLMPIVLFTHVRSVTHRTIHCNASTWYAKKAMGWYCDFYPREDTIWNCLNKADITLRRSRKCCRGDSLGQRVIWPASYHTIWEITPQNGF